MRARGQPITTTRLRKRPAQCQFRARTSRSEREKQQPDAMALLNRFSRLNDRGETGVFTFIVTKSVTRDIHRDATTKDFCFGYHRWAVSFQRPSERVLGVHLLLRNPSPSTSCVVDFTLTLLNRQHFSLNEVYTKCQAKFTITNPMQGVPRWIQISDLVERRFSNETGEFLFELALSNMTTIFECDIQLSHSLLAQYKAMLVGCPEPATGPKATGRGSSNRSSLTAPTPDLINLETTCFTFGAFDWSLTVVPLVMGGGGGEQGSSQSLGSPAGQPPEPVCRVYLNRLGGHDCLCRVKYRVILGHHQASERQPAGEHADSKLLDQISDADGRIRGHQFRHTNLLKLISLRSSCQAASNNSAPISAAAGGAQQQPQAGSSGSSSSSSGAAASASASVSAAANSAASSPGPSSASSLDLRVHIEMFCANTVSEARVPLQRKPNEAQVSNCCDRNKQAWCVESAGAEEEFVRLKLFFVDLQSVPRNHIRYISWIAYLVRRDHKSQHTKESVAVRNSPHSNYYLQDGIDLGTVMDTDVPVKELDGFLDQQQQLMVHIEWVDSLLLFSHLYNNYDALATIQRHQIGQELLGLQLEFDELERKYVQCKRSLGQMLAGARHQEGASPAQPQPQIQTQTQRLLQEASPPPRSQATAPAPRPNWQDQSPQAAALPAPQIQLGQPMSLDERLKFSSSTPPLVGRRRLPQPNYQHRASLEQQSAPLLSIQQHHQAIARRTSSATNSFSSPLEAEQQQHLLASQAEACEQVQPQPQPQHQHQKYGQRAGLQLGQHQRQQQQQQRAPGGLKFPAERAGYHQHRYLQQQQQQLVLEEMQSLQLEAGELDAHTHLRLLASHSYAGPSPPPPPPPQQLPFVAQEPRHSPQYLHQAANLDRRQYSNRL